MIPSQHPDSQLLLLDESLHQQLANLQEKFAAEGQNLSCYLEKLLYDKGVDYSDYLSIETLLTLQKPRTGFPDELVFILFHQISELYFRMILWELEQLTVPVEMLGEELFLDKINRLNRYYRQLIRSFDIMSDGLDVAQFQKFRTALFPGSGFQSLQYRVIEICSTDAFNLMPRKIRENIPEQLPLREIFEKLYWKKGALHVGSGRKSVTLTNFEMKYNALLLQKLKDYKHRNLWQMFRRFYEKSGNSEFIVQALRTFDQLANVGWPFAHYKVVLKALANDRPGGLESTGGTNWSKYLHPSSHAIIFFPQLWSVEERADWGLAH